MKGFFVFTLILMTLSCCVLGQDRFYREYIFHNNADVVDKEQNQTTLWDLKEFNGQLYAIFKVYNAPHLMGMFGVLEKESDWKLKELVSLESDTASHYMECVLIRENGYVIASNYGHFFEKDTLDINEINVRFYNREGNEEKRLEFRGDTVVIQSGNTKYYDSYSTPNGIIEIEGFIFITGYIKKRNSGYSKQSLDVFIAKLDTQGNVIWAKSHGTAETEIAYSVAKTHDGHLVLGGLSNAIPKDGWHNPDGYILKINAETGEIIWESVFYPEPIFYEDWQQLFSIGILSDGTIVGVGSNSEVTSNQYYWVKLDSDGKVLWQKTYPYNSPVYQNGVARKVIVLPDNTFVMAGSSDTQNKNESASKKDAMLIKFDSAGNELWTRIYRKHEQWYLDPDRLVTYVWGAVQTSDGGFALACQEHYQIYDSNRTDYDGRGLIIKVDEYGCLEPGCQNHTGTEPTVQYLTSYPVAEVFPNPALGPVHLQYDLKNFTGGHLLWTDALGRVVQNQKIKTALGKVEFEADRPGLYFYRLDINNGPVLSGTVLVLH